MNTKASGNKLIIKVFGAIIITIIIMVVVGVILQSENSLFNRSENGDNTGNISSDNTNEPTTQSNTSLEETARQVLLALKNKNIAEFASYVHPQQGVRFSPYSYVNDSHDLVFMPDELEAAFSVDTKYYWGDFDGSGLPIMLTFDEYYNEFVYDQDFYHAPLVGSNETIGQGNMLNNMADVYPNAEFVEYHFPGFNPEYAGTDWESLTLILEQDGEKYYLVGIVHGSWTI